MTDQDASIQVVYDIVLETRDDVKDVKKRVRKLEDCELERSSRQAGRIDVFAFTKSGLTGLLGAIAAIIGMGFLGP